MSGMRKKEFEGARDPITLSVIYNRLLTINEEMGITMINTSISPIFAEVHDFSCAICDWDNRIVAQIDGVPSHTASAMEAVKAIGREFEGDIHPGDVFVLNDPYLGGTHLPDVTIMKPIFYEGRLQFIAINRAHHGDVGGMVQAIQRLLSEPNLVAKLSVNGRRMSERCAWEKVKVEWQNLFEDMLRHA